MRNLYRSLTSIVIMILLFMGMGTAFAVPNAPNPVVPVIDETGTLTADQLIMIADTANAEGNLASVYSYIVEEIPAGYNGDVNAAADEVFDLWSLENKNGVLIYISEAEGEVHIQIAESLRENLTDEEMSIILSENIIPPLVEGNYTSGIVAGIQEINEAADNSGPGMFAWFTMDNVKPYLIWIGAGVGILFVLIIGFSVIRKISKTVVQATKSAGNKMDDLNNQLKNELSKAEKKNKELTSQINGMKSRSNTFASTRIGLDSSGINEEQLKKELLKFAETNPNGFARLFDEVSTTREAAKAMLNDSSTITELGNEYVTDAFKAQRDKPQSLSAVGSGSYTPSSYSSSYSSSYDSGYKTSYGSNFSFLNNSSINEDSNNPSDNS